MDFEKKNYRIAFYIRVSTTEQAQNPEGSIKNQEERLKAAVKFKNTEGDFGEVVGVFIDRAKSGKDTKREALQRLLKAIREKEVDLVMMSELSRLSRNIRDFTEMWELMKKQGCGIYSLRENFDTTTAAGEMILYTLANISQFERRQVGERVAANMLARSERGLFNGGNIAFGHQRDEKKKGHLKPHPEESKVVQKVFETFLKEQTLARTAKWLNQNGYTLTRKRQGGQTRSRHFNVTNLYTILKNKTYLGVKSYKKNGKVHQVKACWEAIIDEVSFNKVQKLLKENCYKKKAPSKRRYPYLFSGKITCLECGGILCGKSAHGNSGKVGYYEHADLITRRSYYLEKDFKCQAKRRTGAKLVHKRVLGLIKGHLQEEELAKKLWEKAREIHQNNPNQEEIKETTKSIKRIDDSLEALVERLGEIPKGVSAAPIYKRMEALEKQKEAEQNKLNKLQEVQGKSDELVALKDWSSFAKKMAELIDFEEGDGQEKEEFMGKVLSQLLHKVEIGKEKVVVHYHVGKEKIRGSALSAGPLFFNSFRSNGSKRLTYGGTCWTRTSDHPVMSRGL